jgi:hypothetical protein
MSYSLAIDGSVGALGQESRSVSTPRCRGGSGWGTRAGAAGGTSAPSSASASATQLTVFIYRHLSLQQYE